MQNFEEQTEKVLEEIPSARKQWKSFEIKLKENEKCFNNLRHAIIEWEGALIRANLPFKKITYKSKNSPENMRTEWRG